MEIKNRRNLATALLGGGVIAYTFSLIMHALAYSAFHSIDIFEYERITRSWPLLLFPYGMLIISSILVQSRFIATTLLIVSIIVFYDGFTWLDYGTSLLHADPGSRKAQERLLESAQIVRFSGGFALLVGSAFLFRIKGKVA